MRTCVPLTEQQRKAMLPYKEKVGELYRALDWFRDSILNENRDSRRLAQCRMKHGLPNLQIPGSQCVLTQTNRCRRSSTLHLRHDGPTDPACCYCHPRFLIPLRSTFASVLVIRFIHECLPGRSTHGRKKMSLLNDPLGMARSDHSC